MARIYMGNQEAADRGLLDALRRLGDNYHVFVEFQIPNLRGQRQVDFLVIREDPAKPCMFCLEVKMERRRLRGTINGPWEYEEGPGAWRILPVSNPRDQNPIQQAYNTARAMQAWLASMRTLLQEPDQPWPDVPTVFPRLVLPVAHPENQLQTDSFTWRFDGYERCLESLSTFIPRDPVPLSTAEIERLARHLGVQRLPDAEPEAEPDLQTWMRGTLTKMATEITALRQEVRELRALMGRPPAHAPAGSRYSAPVPTRPGPEGTPPTRDLDLAYRILVEVIRDLRNNGRKLVFPNVQEGLWRRMGQFDVEQYGFFKFKEFLQEAERRGLVRLSVLDGVDYVSLPGEEPQAAPAGTPSNLEDLNPEERARLIEAIAQLESRSAYMIRSYIARHVTASGILPLPMYEVRALINDAVSRGLFQRGSRPFRHPATGEMQSLETLTLDSSHPWVAEVQARSEETAPAPATPYRSQPTWDGYPAGEPEWNGDQAWRGEPPGTTAAQAEGYAPSPNGDTWTDARAEEPGGWAPTAQDTAAEERRAAAEERGEADPWEDTYGRQTAQWSLAAAEAELQGPEEEPAPAPAPTPDMYASTEALPGTEPAATNGHEPNGAAEYPAWQPAPASVQEQAPEYPDEEPPEPIH